MAKQTDKLEKNGRIFYALIQIAFGQNPVFVLGERELMAKSMICADMYDKQTEKILENCLVHVDITTIVETDGGNINLSEPTSHIDAMTPRYWFTNTNHDGDNLNP